MHSGSGLLTTVNSKSYNNPNGRHLNGSQLSLLSERSQHQYFAQPQQHHHVHRTNALNLGIPHTEASSSYESPNGNNMPRELEDFDDLIKYSQEEERQRQQQQPGPTTHHHHPSLKGKGSNVSIGGHSSGYQSIQTQSQSSSPIENVMNSTNGNNAPSIIQQNIEFFNSKIQSSSSSSNASTTNRPKKLNGKYGYINPKYSVVPPLAFKNPLYQMQGNNNNNNDGKSSSLTPSSSEERITIDQNMMNNNIVSSSSNVPGLIESTVNGRRLGSNRVPRTNPLAQVSDTLMNHKLWINSSIIYLLSLSLTLIFFVPSVHQLHIYSIKAETSVMEFMTIIRTIIRAINSHISIIAMNVDRALSREGHCQTVHRMPKIKFIISKRQNVDATSLTSQLNNAKGKSPVYKQMLML